MKSRRWTKKHVYKFPFSYSAEYSPFQVLGHDRIGSLILKFSVPSTLSKAFPEAHTCRLGNDAHADGRLSVTVYVHKVFGFLVRETRKK